MSPSSLARDRTKPEHVYRVCQKVSVFLVEFMDNDFYRRMLEYARGKKA
jgi:hypothetical protein